MKRQNTSKIKKTHERIAVLDAKLVRDASGFYQLLPCGDFSARDGRPTDTARNCWTLNAENAAKFIAATAAIGQPILIDYDHQTLTKEQTGQKALAAGWIDNPATDIKFVDGLGIYIKPRWTPAAKTEIKNQEYCYLSAVFPYDSTGNPLYLRMAAITNDPGVVGLEALAVLNAQFQQHGDTNDMNELLRAMLIALGVISSDDTAELTPEQITELAPKVTDAIQSLKDAAQAAVDAKEAPTPESAAKAIDNAALEINAADSILNDAKLSAVDLTKYVPVNVYNSLRQQFAALSANNAELTVEQIIGKAKNKGQVVAAELDYLRAVGEQQGVAALSAIIDVRAPIAALTSRQTAAVKTPEKTAALTAEDLAVIAATGITKEDFLKSKEALQ